MFRRKLCALEYPDYESFNINDIVQFRCLVLWLEDQKIRHYKIEDRNALRDVHSADWDKAFKQYKEDVACPIKGDKSAEVLEWLLGSAVKLEHGDNLEKYKSQTSEKLKSESKAPVLTPANPLDCLDFKSSEFVQGVHTLAQLLNLTRHTDHLVTLKAISKFVCQRLSSEALENPGSVIAKGTPLPIEVVEPGFAVSDPMLMKASQILRLLYLQDLRDLQTRINETFVAVQNVTANPKTDTRLGKVGK